MTDQDNSEQDDSTRIGPPIPTPRGSNSWWELLISYAWITGLLLAVVYGVYRVIHTAANSIATDILITMHPNLGWLLEVVLAFVVIVLMVATLGHLWRIFGGGFLSGLKSNVASIAHDYDAGSLSDLREDEE